MKRKILLGVAVIAGFMLLYLLLWPVGIDPVAWTPPEAPTLAGVYEPNDLLAAVERLGVGAGVGPEDVCVDREGRIYGGMENGRIMQILPEESRVKVFADTGGRPLGLRFDAAGNLVVADAYKGLLSISPEGAVSLLGAAADGVPFGLTDGVDIAADGTIYVSDASSKFPLKEYMTDMIEHRPHGRLLAYDPELWSMKTVLDNLYFANGVAVSPDQTFVLVNETAKYRVRRLWLSGPRRGESDIFIDNLPGYPDGISSNGKDTFWVALFAPRDPKLDALLPRPFWRKMIMRLPEAMMPAPKRYGFVLGLDVTGRVVYNLQDPAGSFAPITSVREYNGMLYLGSITENAVGRVPVPQKF